MPSYVYKPECYLANERGMVEKNEDYYVWLSFNSGDDKRMFRGNEPVVVRFNSDSMPETRHMSDGKYYTSKSKFRKTTKAYGCIEVGDQTHYVSGKRRPKTTSQIYKERKQRRDDIKKAIHEIRNGRDIMKEVRSIPRD